MTAINRIQTVCRTLGEAGRNEAMERFINAMDAQLNPQQGDADKL